MDKKIIIVTPVVLLLLAGIALAAMPNPVETQRGKATVTIPANAVEVSPGVFYLGNAFHEGRIVQGYAFVKYKKEFVKPSGCRDDGVCQGWEDSSCADCSGSGEPDTSSCYGFLAKGAKWKTVEPWVVNPSNTRELNEQFVFENLVTDITKWEDAAGTDILGGGSTTTETLIADIVSPDNKNEVYFADISTPRAIGVTIVWGIFGGPPPFRELVEWDQVYDDFDFDWSADCETEDCSNKMDFESIATHELGHSVGLDDLYTNECSEVTMYGYADYGETKKRILEDGDVAGVSALY